jgi:hypothetical protein
VFSHTTSFGCSNHLLSQFCLHFNFDLVRSIIWLGALIGKPLPASWI